MTVECRSSTTTNFDEKHSDYEISFIVENLNNNKFIIDSGATSHMY